MEYCLSNGFELLFAQTDLAVTDYSFFSERGSCLCQSHTHSRSQWNELNLEKKDSLGMNSCRKRLWDYLGGRRSKQTWRNLVRNVIDLFHKWLPI